MSASVNLCAKRKYMRSLMRQRIKACIANTPSMYSVDEQAARYGRDGFQAAGRSHFGSQRLPNFRSQLVPDSIEAQYRELGEPE